MKEGMFGPNEVISVKQAFDKFMSRPVLYRMAFHDILDISEGKGNPEVIKLYPGWKDVDFKNLSEQLTKAVQEGRISLG